MVMPSKVKKSAEELESLVAIVLAIIATRGVAIVKLRYSRVILNKVGSTVDE